MFEDFTTTTLIFVLTFIVGSIFVDAYAKQKKGTTIDVTPLKTKEPQQLGEFIISGNVTNATIYHKDRVSWIIRKSRNKTIDASLVIEHSGVEIAFITEDEAEALAQCLLYMRKKKQPWDS